MIINWIIAISKDKEKANIILSSSNSVKDIIMAALKTPFFVCPKYLKDVKSHEDIRAIRNDIINTEGNVIGDKDDETVLRDIGGRIPTVVRYFRYGENHIKSQLMADIKADRMKSKEKGWFIDNRKPENMYDDFMMFFVKRGCNSINVSELERLFGVNVVNHFMNTSIISRDIEDDSLAVMNPVYLYTYKEIKK